MAAPERPPVRRPPSVDALLRSGPGRKASAEFGRAVVKRAVQDVLADARSRASAGREVEPADLLMATAVERAARASFGLQQVINATGVILHTGLGRAPLPPVALRAAVHAAEGYADLEVDRTTGRRGTRSQRAEFLLTALTGAETAFVVNNNAGALVLLLAALARRKDVLVSRGELIEIGGEFRLPDIMAASGARLLEVGTTNRTRTADFRRALSDRTGLILKVHPSNYRVVGFTDAAPAAELSAVARAHGVPFAYDLGSGLLDSAAGIPVDEPAATEALAAGADVVTFSGDKLLGGPQAGIAIGRADLIAKLRKHPLARALRVDKMQVAALEAVLRLHAAGREDELPTWRMLRASAASIRRRARAVAAVVGGEVVRVESAPGGGSLPGHALPSWAVRVADAKPDALAARLREERPTIFARVDDGAVLFDLRTVPPEDDERLARAVRYARGQT
ncbi:MAG TPA: L-seryl-tRNA(Sec) selenium transferase [Actinomycetota bacterium]|nr:L-seryl-tRNA(Sec) selenium transferase [Actinomycetota bacterium]